MSNSLMNLIKPRILQSQDAAEGPHLATIHGTRSNRGI